ncbi:UDP-N-acetylmuramoyl-tripeptide--D-alanyl-D-alanine ligase [Verrucomicrobiaceae bacterium R5-34]|nr:UDP-N-acetylmuramoyl-tripeptide--D-alanyl-D-alanine ligase [Verrucomicrobiaceae bacterium R5-34]
MKPLSITDIASAIGAELVGTDTGRLIRAVSTDTRSLGEGSLFVALRGDNFDGHHFVSKAVENGAECLLLDILPEEVEDLKVPVLLVKNSLYGLQRLAKWYRDLLDINVIGITGSNGKTSTKDFTSSVLRQKFQVNATKGNLNNHIGLPLSVLATKETDQVCVWEMGMNHAGEIAPLCDIASPDIGIITNVGTAHIEHLGSREGIAEEKASLARALPENGTLIVTASCDFVDYLIGRTTAKVVVTGNCRGSVRAENLQINESGSSFDLCIEGEVPAHVELNVSGRHMVNNSLLAAAAGFTLGMTVEEIAAGLNATQLTTGRLRRFVSNGITVIDDTYNANPDSVAAAIETLTDLPVHNGNRRIVVLGMMAELGVHADAEHLRVGKLAAEKDLQVVAVGAKAAKIYEGASAVTDKAVSFDEPVAAAEWLKSFCKEGDRVLFKGSRMAAMENVMNEAFPQT